MKISRILAPIDFSDGSRIAVEYAIELGRRYGSPIDLLFVWTPEAYVLPEMTGALTTSMPVAPDRTSEAVWEADMRAFRESLDAQDVEIGARIECGHPAETIIRVAEGGAYDLIAMGTHGRTGIEHVLLGSVAERVVRRAHCPVLTVPLSKHRSEEAK